MPPLTPHRHNGSDAPKLYFGESMQRAPQEAVTALSGTAGGTYTASEQTLINDTVTSVNDLITKLQTLGILE